MCTVTYLPGEQNRFILTSNRDEGVKRQRPDFPKVLKHNETELILPKDVAGGTWIGLSGLQRTVVLLNGAFQLHTRQLPYRMSRGIIVMEALSTRDITGFLQHYDLDNIEPFTLLVIDWSKELFFTELRWDGNQRHLKEIDTAQPHIWSSATLYNDEMQQLRESWFATWLSRQEEYRVASIRHFHKSAGEGDPITNLITERGFLKTLSVTTVNNMQEAPEMIYEDLTTNKTTTVNFNTKPAVTL